MPSIISFISQIPAVTTNSFTTIQTPSGTSPTASSPTDTLTLTSTDGSVVITGNSATDTIDFSVVDAPVNATYVTLSNNATLTNERVLTGTTNQVIITDNGANSTVVLSLPQSINTGASPTFTGLTLSGLTSGSVIFAGTSGVISQNNSKFFWDDSNQNLSIGNNQTTQVIDGANEHPRVILESSGSANQMDLFVHRHAATSTFKSDLGLARSRGTSGSPSAINTGDYVGAVDFFGHDGTSWRYAAQIRAEIDSGTVSSSSMPGLIRFLVTPNTTIVPAEALKITNDKIITMAVYGAGVAQFSSSGVISSTAPSTSGNVLQSNGTAWVSNSLSTGGIAPNTLAYVTIGNTASLTAERALTGTANQIVITDNGANSTVVLSAPQDIATSSSPTFTGLTLQTLTLSGSTASQFINGNGTLDNATGNETAYSLQYAVNKATSGNSTGLVVAGLFTSAPGTNYLLDLQNTGFSKFAVDNGGNLYCSSTIFQFNTITSLTFQNALAQALLFIDSTNTKLLQNGVTLAMAAASSGTPIPGLTHTGALHTSLAEAEATDVFINLDRLVTFAGTGGSFANQRALRITAPVYDISSSSETIDTASAISISGPPKAGPSGAMTITTSMGFQLEQRTLTANTTAGIGFVIYGPTGAFTSNSCGAFMNGSVGFNTLTPQCLIHGNATGTGGSITFVDGAVGRAAYYFGSATITTISSNRSNIVAVDGNFSPTANTATNPTGLYVINTLGGTHNFTGAPKGSNIILRHDGSGTTGTIGSLILEFNSTSSATNTVTIAKICDTKTSLVGTSTITTLVAYDNLFTFTNVAGTVSTAIGMRVQAVSVGAAFTATNFVGVQLDDQTATFGGTKIGFYQKGTNLQNRFVSTANSFGQDTTANATIDVVTDGIIPTLYGSNAASGDLTLGSTKNATKRNILFGTSAYSELNNRLGLGTTSPTNILSASGQSAQTWWLERNTTSNTAGNSLTLQASGATSGATDKSGGQLILAPGANTGTGRSNVTIKKYSVATATGTGDGTQLDAECFGCFKALANNTNTAITNFTLASNTVIAGIIRYSVEVFNGTDLQVEVGSVSFHTINKGGVFSNNVVTKYGNQQAATSGTLTVTWTITGANPSVLTVNANSSLTPSTGYPRLSFTVENLNQQAMAVQ